MVHLLMWQPNAPVQRRREAPSAATGCSASTHSMRSAGLETTAPLAPGCRGSSAALGERKEVIRLVRVGNRFEVFVPPATSRNLHRDAITGRFFDVE